MCRQVARSRRKIHAHTAVQMPSPEISSAESDAVLRLTPTYSKYLLRTKLNTETAAKVRASERDMRNWRRPLMTMGARMTDASVKRNAFNVTGETVVRANLPAT